MAEIHASAVVEPGAVLADDVVVGPFAWVGPEVELSQGVRVGPHASVMGRTRVGARTRISPYACLGGAPQVRDLSEPGRLEIGCDNDIREFVSIHVGTPMGTGCTRIGDSNMILNNAHIAHDCQVGSQCTVTGPGGLAGHALVEDHAVLAAFSGVHQHARVGESAMAASNAMLSKDAPPFSLVAGDRARVIGVNTLGLRRRNFSAETISNLKRAFQVLFKSRLQFAPAVGRVRDEISGCREVDHLLSFLEQSERGFCR